LLLLSLGGWPAPAATGTPAARELFQQHCVKCHGADGTGRPARTLHPEIPDFTAATWQARRSAAQLQRSILDGTSKDMPPFRGKIDEKQARDLVAYVQTLAQTTGKPGPETEKKSTSPSGFEEEFRRLQKEMDELQRQFDELSKGSGDRQRSRPSEHSPRSTPGKPSASAATVPPVRELFRRHCVKCHGDDGTGSAARGQLPAVPNFTEASWQARRSDAQLLASILDGKGPKMPPWRDKIREEETRGLVAYVRAFSATPGGSEEQEQEAPPPTEAEAAPLRSSFEKLIGWLGKFHPAAVHFPIALLTAAAVAELLRMVTGRPALDAVVRYCLWFATLTAVVAGTLGWFLGEFRLTDASWVLTTHRWLGTATVACAGLVLLLSQVSRRPDRRRTRIGFRVTLLVVAVLALVTGFFGGAVVYGLDHYAWPP
jgi:mono/diheme cytochrome c family protein/uncharacterized membrane protein